MTPVVRRSLVTQDIDPIYNEALPAFQTTLTEYPDILPNAGPKNLKKPAEKSRKEESVNGLRQCKEQLIIDIVAVK